MNGTEQYRTDLFLLLSLVVVILAYPVLDLSPVRRLILAALIFVPVILATVRLSQMEGWVWRSTLLMSGTIISGVAACISPGRVTGGFKWGFLIVFVAHTIVGLFSHLVSARTIMRPQLQTAASIYLLIGLLWFAAYCLIELCFSGSFSRGHDSDLLYFSFATLTTVGYGDVVPQYSEVRVFAVLEAVTGVLYIAITVAIFVSKFRQPDNER
jgi:hypothetical protein